MIEPIITLRLGGHVIEQLAVDLDHPLVPRAMIRIDGRPFWGTFSEALDVVEHMMTEGRHW